MIDSTALRLISGFLGLLVFGFIVFLIAGTIHMHNSESQDVQANAEIGI